MNKQLAEMVQEDLRAARQGWAETVEAIDKLLLLDFEHTTSDEVVAELTRAARGMRNKAQKDATMSNLAFVIFEAITK